MKTKLITLLSLCLFLFSQQNTLNAQCLSTTITSSGGSEVITCPGDGIQDRIRFRPSTFATLYTYVVTDTNNIILNSFFGSIFDFENAGIGVCRVYGVSFAGQVNVPIGENILDASFSSFCSTVSSNYITVIRGGDNESIVQTPDGETTVSVCAGDGNPDVVEFVSMGALEQENFTFVITDQDNVVLGIPGGNSQDFDGAGQGVCRVYGLSYDGELSLMVGDLLNPEDFTVGCVSSLSSNYLTVDRTGLTGGTVATFDGETSISTCVGDGAEDLITFSSEGASPDANFTYVVTTSEGIVLGIPEGNIQDFEGAGVGECWVYGLAYSGDLLLAAGDDINTADLATDCASLSENVVTVNRLIIDGGRVTTIAGDTLVYICPGDGIDNIIEFNNEGASTDGTFTYIVTDAGGLILSIPTGNSQNFDGAGIGSCRVYGLTYLGDLNAEVGDSLDVKELASNCYDLSNNYLEVVRDTAEAGVVSLADGNIDTTICIIEGESNILEFANQGASSAQFTYIVTDAEGIVLGIPPANMVDFAPAGLGTCLVYGLSYTGNLSVAPGDTLANVSLSDDCFDLSDEAITVNRIEVSVGSVSDINNDTLIYTCPADGLSNVIRFRTVGISDGANITYIVTDSDNVILGVPEADSLDFEPAGFGVCRVYSMAYLGELTATMGDTVGVNSLATSCFDITENYITVVRDTAEAGNVSLLDGSLEITLCAGDGLPDVVGFTGSGSSAADFTYIVTDSDGVVLGIPAADSLDFEGSGVGTCAVFGLSFTGNLTVMPGDTLMNVALSDECYDLSNNNITIIRQEPGNAGTVSTIDGETEIEVILGDGNLSVVEFQTTATGAENFSYIVTNEDFVIIAVPSTAAVNFEGAGVGTCLVHGITYNGELMAQAGDTLGVNTLVEGCFDLSDNFITITRTEFMGLELDSVFTVAGETVIYTCPSDGIADSIAFDHSPIPADVGFTYIVTDDQDVVLGLPEGNIQDFEGAGFGACRVYGLLYFGNVTVAAGDTIGIATLADDEHDLSDNYVTVNRDTAEAGTLLVNGSLAAFACVDDGISDEFTFEIDGASSANYQLVVTNGDNQVIGLPEGITIDFEGAGQGVCQVYGLSYTGDLLVGLGDVIDAETTMFSTSCFDLPLNPVTVIRRRVDGGAVATADSLTSLSIFVNDGVADTLYFISEGATSSTDFTYVVTDSEDVILGIPAGDFQDFEGAGEGVCRVYGLSYTGDLIAMAGDTLGTIALADQCFDLSDNFVEVTRIDSSGALKPVEIVDNRTATTKNYTLKVAPNPAQTQTNIAFEMAKEQQVVLEVFNLTGRVVYQQSVDAKAGLNQVDLDIYDWNNGVYFVRLNDGQASTPVRFLKVQ